jgi:O-acetyl-ADP-ribose deacetylase (regulator of RNase III)
MPLEIIRDDISRLSTDAIVHTTNTNLIRGRGSSESIFKSAGFKLEEALQEIGHCEVGEAVITPGFNLASKYIIHTVGPIWMDGLHNESKILESCYKNCLNIALKHELKSIAFPLISAGTYGYPKDEALRIATSTIQSFLLKHEMKVYLVVFDKQVYQLSTQLFDSVKQYVDDHYVEIRGSRQRINSEETNFRTYKKISYESSTSIDDILLELDSSFSETLLKLIDQKDLRDVDVYKRANISKAHFSKIRSHKDYRPTKTTVLAFCISLKLNLSETRDLLEKAGFSLSNSSKGDIIVRYFIENKRYDIYEVNEVLFEYDQQLLGSNTI